MTRTRPSNSRASLVSASPASACSCRTTFGHAETFEVQHGGVQSDGLGDRRRAGLEARRAVGRGVAVGADVGDHAAAAEERRHRVQDVLAGPKDADARRSEHLVTGEDQEVDVERDDVGRQVGDGLRAVDRDQRTVAMRDGREFADRIDRARARSTCR